MPKRRHSQPLTLWTAAKVAGHANLETWLRDRTPIRRLVSGVHPGRGTTVDDVRHTPAMTADIDAREAAVTVKAQKAAGNDELKDAGKKAKKIRPDVESTCCAGLRPSPEQKLVLELMLRVYNTAYNWCVWLVREHDISPKQFALQKYVATTKRDPRPYGKGDRVSEGVKDGLVDPEAEWLFDEDVGMCQHRLLAAKSYAAMHKSAYTNWKNKGSVPDQKPVMKTKRTSNISTGSFGVQKIYVHTPTQKQADKYGVHTPRRYLSVLPGVFEMNDAEPLMKLSRKKGLRVPVTADCTITRRPNNKWVLNLPCDANLIRSNPATPPTKLAGVDPGIKTMVTVYDATDHDAWEMGLESDYEKMKPLMERARRLESLSSDARKKGQNQEADGRSRAARKIRRKVSDYIGDIHSKFKHHVVTNFALVAHGDINVKSIIKKRENGTRGLSRRAKDKMLMWSHYKLKRAVMHRAEGTDCVYALQNEAYTSKTCGVCDNVKTGLTLADRMYECRVCGHVSHRDVNAARNILRRTLGMWSPPVMIRKTLS